MREPTPEEEIVAPWMAVAKRYLGVNERVGNELNPRVRAMFRNTRFPQHLINLKTAWCGAFLSTVLEEAGYEHPHSAAALHFLRMTHELETPRYGAILVFSRGVAAHEDSTTIGHVAFCAEQYPTHRMHILCLGGNQHNRVCTMAQPRARLLGVRWPEPRKKENEP